MPHNGNWRRFDFTPKFTESKSASFEELQKVCHHPASYRLTEMTGSGDNVKIKTICYLCLATISEE